MKMMHFSTHLALGACCIAPLYGADADMCLAGAAMLNVIAGVFAVVT